MVTVDIPYMDAMGYIYIYIYVQYIYIYISKYYLQALILTPAVHLASTHAGPTSYQDWFSLMLLNAVR